jgi:hypothetical protein
VVSDVRRGRGGCRPGGRLVTGAGIRGELAVIVPGAQGSSPSERATSERATCCVQVAGLGNALWALERRACHGFSLHSFGRGRGEPQ